MAYETLTYEKDGPVAVLTLNRPKRLNAINQRMVDEIRGILGAVEEDEAVRALVLTGAGRAFCAGFDLKEEAEDKPMDVAGWRRAIERDFDMIMGFWHSTRPTIAAVHGYCIAGGLELALACDITIAAEGTMFGEPELRFGTGIVALLLPWVTGPKQAKELLLTGDDRVPAERALAMGLVNRVVPAGEELETALALARTIAVMDRDAVAMTKSAINRTYEMMGMREALRAGLDTEVLIESLETPERKRFKEIAAREGLKAAIAWRDSRFPGRATGGS